MLKPNNSFMKKIQITAYFIIICTITKGQIFYIENFTTGGAGWNLASVQGPEGADPNFWKVFDEEGGGITPNLGAPASCGVASNGNNSLFITSVFNPMGGAAYDAGGSCGILFCPQANRRAESPIISCVGKTNISINFNYIEGGENTIDDATLWYFDGSIWTQIDNMPKTLLGCSGQGLWASRSIVLPTSANGNANVKIGFRWQNDDNGIGSDPSIAIDDITLSTSASTIPLSITLPSPVCVTTTLSATYASTATPTTFTWSTNSPNVIFTPVNSGTTIISFNSAGTFTVSLTACESGTCATATSTIQVLATPVVNVVASSSAICTPNSSTLTASGATSYTWNPATTLSSANGATVTATPTITTTYIITGETSNCSGSTTVTVLVNTPTLSLTPNFTICLGNAALITATTNATSILWNTGIVTNTLLVSPSINTVYTVTLNLAGCSKTNSVAVTVLTNITAGINTTFTDKCNGILNFTCANNSLNNRWLISNGDTILNSCQFPYQFSVAGNYTVTLITNPNSNCADTAKTPININAISGSVYESTPNVFTPNGDGINDLIDFSKYIACAAYEFEIFDRWGLSILKATNTKQTYWDGRTSSGIEVNDGTYFFILRTISSSYRGIINVFR